MRNDEWRAAGQCQLKNQIILQVRQVGPPKEMNPALEALGQEIVQEIADVLWRVVGQQARTTEDILILRQSGGEMTGWNCVEPIFWTSRNEAPRRERRAETRTFVSITTRTRARLAAPSFGARREAVWTLTIARAILFDAPQSLLGDEAARVRTP